MAGRNLQSDCRLILLGAATTQVWCSLREFATGLHNELSVWYEGATGL